MYCGLDFGTSNCSIGDYCEGIPRLIPIDGNEIQMPSAVFSLRKTVVAKPIDEREVDRLTDQLFRNQSKGVLKKIGNALGVTSNTGEKRLNREEVEKLVRSRLQRDSNAEALRKYKELGVSSISRSSKMIIGSDAIKEHALRPDDGIFAKSPKSFLGSDLKAIHLSSFGHIVREMLTHIKYSAESYTQSSFDSVVLGRPVNYNALTSSAGNSQALNIMRDAAASAGFKNIEFEYEPVAAARDFERTLSHPSLVLVVDIGGGTTDVTMIHLSSKYANYADREKHILAADGTRIGGNDLDILFSLYKIARHLGKESLDNDGLIINRNSPVPLNIYWNAVQINNVHSVAEFQSQETAREINNCLSKTSGEMRTMLERLRVLQAENYSYRFNRSAEMGKILLSSKENIHLPLRYLGDDLVVELNRHDLADAISSVARKIRNLIDDTVAAAGSTPEYIYVTGGSAKSPNLMELIFSNDMRKKIVSGDFFGSVTHGLVISSRNRFG